MRRKDRDAIEQLFGSPPSRPIKSRPAVSYSFSQPTRRVEYHGTTGAVITEHVSNRPMRFTNYVPGPIVKGDHVRPNPFYMRKVDWRAISGTQRFYLPGGGSNPPKAVYVSDGPLSNSAGLAMKFKWSTGGTPPVPTAFYNEVTSKFYESISDVEQWNVEALEYAAMRHRGRIDKSYRNLDRVSSGVKKQVIRTSYNTRSATKKIADLWLQKQYVWEPSIKAIFNSALAVQQASMRPVYLKVSKTLVAGDEWSELTPTDRGVLPTNFTSGRRLGLKFVVALRSNNLGVQDFMSLDPALIAWQLLPYSFVVDWVYNVGSYMQQAETALRFNSRFLFGSQTVSWREVVQARCESTGANVFGPYLTLGVGGGTYKGFSRSLLTTLPQVRPPVIDVSLSSSRLFSLAALLAQRLKVGKWADYIRNF